MGTFSQTGPIKTWVLSGGHTSIGYLTELKDSAVVLQPFAPKSAVVEFPVHTLSPPRPMPCICRVDPTRTAAGGCRIYGRVCVGAVGGFSSKLSSQSMSSKKTVMVRR